MNRFEEAMKMDEEIQKHGKEYLEASRELALEIARKPDGTETEAEKKFVMAFTLMSLMMMIHKN